MFVTHQLRNPIVAIGGFTDQLLKPGLPTRSRSQRNLSIIRDEIRRLEDIIYQIGHFLKVSLKEPVYFDSGPSIAAVLESPEIQAKAGEGPPERQARARARPRSSAIRPPSARSSATSSRTPSRRRPPDGTVTVRRLPQERSLVRAVSVRDTGPGHHRSRTRTQLFRPFFTTKEKGMGLGLPFVKRVMDTCGGKIEVQSREGKGTMFRLHLPSAEERERRHEEEDPARRGREAALPALRGGAEPGRLRGRRPSPTPMPPWPSSEKTAFDLIITDIRMPGKNGDRAHHPDHGPAQGHPDHHQHGLPELQGGLHDLGGRRLCRQVRRPSTSSRPRSRSSSGNDMSELRKDLVSGRWVIIATERSKRPDDFRPRRARAAGRRGRPASARSARATNPRRRPRSSPCGPPGRRPTGPAGRSGSCPTSSRP